MRVLKHFLIAGAAAAFAVAVATPASAEMAIAALKDKSGKAVGDVDLQQTLGGVLLKLSVKGLTPGEHAFHIHAVGKCEAPFDSAGGHFNPGGHKHGMMSGHAHAGDMPNLHVLQSGELTVEILNSAITLEKGKPNSVFDADGSSIVIHAGPDDYKSDPDGKAGERIACGVIQASGTPPATVGSPPKK
jgi:superoxide dismutase, Cu-Zn family